jgi:hypothetical protein
MSYTQNSRTLNCGLFFLYLAIASCSNEYNHDVAENINLEFELTYRYVVENMAIKVDYSSNFSNFKKRNMDAFTSIAYTWHTVSLDACELTVGNNRTSNKTSYEQITHKPPTNDNLPRTIDDDDRPCLAKIYFDNWANIQNMLLLSYPDFK